MHQNNVATTTELRLIDSLSAFKSLKADWETLYEQSPCSTIFSSWDWMYTWWECFHTQYQRKLLILCLYDKASLVGIAPFYTEVAYPKAFLQGKTLRFIGTGAETNSVQSEFTDLMVAPDYEAVFIEEVSYYLQNNKQLWNFADFEFLIEDALILRCFDGENAQISRQVIPCGERFYTEKMQSVEDYESNMSNRWKKMFAKKSRLLERDGRVEITSTDSVESVSDALALLADMHCARWEGKITTECVFSDKNFYTFHEQILARLVPKKKAFIRTLTLNDEPLASYYAFEDKKQIHYYQSGFYQKYSNKYSPLFILVCKEIRAALTEQKVFDFMFDDNPNTYKKKQYAMINRPMLRLKWTPQAVRFKASALVMTIKKNLSIKITRDTFIHIGCSFPNWC